MMPVLKLREMRRTRGWTLRELGRRSGVSYSTIAKIEAGIRNPSDRTTQRLDSALGLEAVLGTTGDGSFDTLKLDYGLSARLVEGISTVSTTQKRKPLQIFDNPYSQRDYHVRIPFPEFTSLCPKTGQPDFAVVTVDYVPDQVCVELKALKLYYNSYRNEGHFIEELANLILDDLVKVLSPRWIEVLVEFNTRGGMAPVVRVWEKSNA